MRKVLILTLSLALLAGFAFGAAADTDLTFRIKDPGNYTNGLKGVKSNITYGEGNEFDGEIEALLHVNWGLSGAIYTGTGFQEGQIDLRNESGSYGSLSGEMGVNVSGSEEQAYLIGYSDDANPSTDRLIFITGFSGADDGSISFGGGNPFHFKSKSAYTQIQVIGSGAEVIARDTTGGDVTLLTGFWRQNKNAELSTDKADLMSIESLTVQPGSNAKGKQILNSLEAMGDTLFKSGSVESHLLSGSEATVTTSLLIDSVDLEVIAAATWSGSGYFSNGTEITEP